MKRIVIPISCALLLPLTGCLEETSSNGNRTIFKVDENAPKPEGARYGYGAQSAEEEARLAAKRKPGEGEELPPPTLDGTGAPVEGANPGTDPVAVVENPPIVTDTEKPAKVEPPTAAAPVAQMIPGKAGQVYSPFAPGKPIDVSGYPPGTLMRCPYTGKEFKVP